MESERQAVTQVLGTLGRVDPRTTVGLPPVCDELDEAPSQLAAEDVVAAELTEPRLFAGLTLTDATASATSSLGPARRAADTVWASALGCLFDALTHLERP